MRSHLNVRVFRRILANEGYLPAHSFCGSLLSTNRVRRRGHAPTKIPRRSFFSWLEPTKKEPRSLDFQPGIVVMYDLIGALQDNERLPSMEQIMQGWRTFVAFKLDKKEPLQDFETQVLTQTFRYFMKVQKEEGTEVISKNDIYKAMMLFNILPDGSLGGHRYLAQSLTDELKLRRNEQVDLTDDLPANQLYPLVKLISLQERMESARDIALKCWKQSPDAQACKLFTLCLEGSAHNGDTARLEKTLEMMEQNGVPLDAKGHKAVTIFYAARDDIEKTKQWYTHPLAEEDQPLDTTNYAVIHFSRRNNQLDWFGSTLQAMLKETPNKRSWDSIFVWAAAIGKSVQEINRMMDVMVEKSGEDAEKRPNGFTILGLMEYAQSIGDNTAAAAYAGLGASRGIQLDEVGVDLDASAVTRLIDLRLDVDDVQGAMKAYQNLQGFDLTDKSDVPTINRLIQVLCAADAPNLNVITELVADLEERGTKLYGATVASILKLHLANDDFDSVEDLLNVHRFHMPAVEQGKLFDIVEADFHNSHEKSDDRTWTAYVVMRQVFLDMRGVTIYPLMSEFFRRNRPDQAVLVFSGMTQASPDQQPPFEAYVQFFTQLGEVGSEEEEDFQTVYNYMKMDLSIELNTRLRNALMQALMACEQTSSALEVWKDIDHSSEGPDTNSITIALRACERISIGHIEAEKIWSKVTKYGIDITVEMYAAYLSAMMRGNEHERVFGLVESMEADMGLKPNLHMIASIYNSFTDDLAVKDQIAEWAKAKFPELWSQLETYERKDDFDMEANRLTRKYNFSTYMKL